MKVDRPSLLENRDYTVRADGAWVFTREYLLARGTCCGSKCVNCPYENARETPLPSRPVISFVPSWTETLIHAGANVVGRTRFCIHPHDAIRKISSWGGTKTLATDVDAKFQAVVSQARGIRPLVILDKEENPLAFFEYFSKLECDIAVTHVRNLETLCEGFEKIAVHFSPRSNLAPGDENVRRQFGEFQARARQLVTESTSENVASSSKTATFGPACLKANVSLAELDRLVSQTKAPILYFIWKDPWMVVSDQTWIAEALNARFQGSASSVDSRRLFSGSGRSNSPSEVRPKYPVIQEYEVPKESVLLFSSEPYPFERAWQELLSLEFVRHAKAAALVDGERFSWFGIRAIRFLEER